MNPTELSPAGLGRLRGFLVTQLVEQGRVARNPYTLRRLADRANELHWRASACYSPDPSIRAEVAQLLEEAIDDLVDVITNGEPTLAEGALYVEEG